MDSFSLRMRYTTTDCGLSCNDMAYENELTGINVVIERIPWFLMCFVLFVRFDMSIC